MDAVLSHHLIIISVLFCFHPICCFQSICKCMCLCVKENHLTFRTGGSEEFLDVGKLRTEFYVLKGKGGFPGESCEI